METAHISLLELNKLIQSRLLDAFPETYWIVAEIAQLKENINGHCYLELTETTGKSNKIVAQAKAMIWSNTWRMLKPYFETTTKQPLREGLKVLIRVKIDFHEIYGMSFGIFDIDPSYTVGDLAIKKTEIVRKLQEEGIFDMNRELEMSLVPQRIAIISSETAAGYTDFVTHLANNSGNYKFHTKLFQSYMQGERTEQSIIDALDRINNEIEKFDVVVIIRGGGSQTDLSAFDSYWMAVNISQFPIPIITGIGHEENESIADMVAHTALKTPTAVANYIIDKVTEFENSLLDLEQQFTEYITDIIDEKKSQLDSFYISIPHLIRNKLNEENQHIKLLSTKLSLGSKGLIHQNINFLCTIPSRLKNTISRVSRNNDQYLAEYLKTIKKSYIKQIEKQHSQLNLFQKTNELSNPIHILKKGYSITTFNGQILKNIVQINEDDIIKTTIQDGQLLSKVISH